MTQQYVLVERQIQPSRLTPGADMYRLVFYGLDDGVLWEMTTDAGFRNFRRSGWNLLMQESDPWGVYQGLKRTQRTTADGMPIITADSRPDRIYKCTDRDEALRLVEADQRERNPTAFERLFDADTTA